MALAASIVTWSSVASRFSIAEVEIDQLEVEIGKDQLVLDQLPDDAGHLVAVELDDGIGDLDLGHGADFPLGGWQARDSVTAPVITSARGLVTPKKDQATAAMAGTDSRKALPPGPSPCVILVNPQLGENIGTAARAMANFGLSELRLVDPRDGWPNDKARAAASGADQVIDGAARVRCARRGALPISISSMPRRRGRAAWSRR